MIKKSNKDNLLSKELINALHDKGYRAEVLDITVDRQRAYALFPLHGKNQVSNKPYTKRMLKELCND